MIDYEKLKFAHKSAEKLKYDDVSITWHYNMPPRSGYFVLCFEDEDNLSHEYEYFVIDDLIAKLQELTETQPKYEVGQNVFWLDERAGGHIFHGVINAICRNQSDTMYGYDIDHLNYAEYKEMFPMAVSSSRWQLWDDDKLYPTKQALIESQITYWQSLLEPKECQHLWVRGKCYDCGIDKECQHESDRESFVKENGVPPGLTARFKCKKCGEFYK